MFDPSTEPDTRIMAFLAAAERPALTFVALVAGLVFVFWLVPPLGNVAPVGWSMMALSTSIALLLTTASVYLSRERAPPRELRIARVLALAVTGFATLVLGLEVTGLGAETGPFQMPTVQTSIALLLGGATLTVMSIRGFPQLAVDACAIVYLSVLLFIFGGMLFHAVSFTGSADGRLTSPQTLLSMIVLGLMISGRLSLRKSLFALFADVGLGSRIARNMLPVVLITPFVVFALVGYLYESGTLTVNFTRALFAPLVVLGVLALIAFMGIRINALERGLRMQSVTDHLTKVLNRRGFAAVSEYVARSAARAGTDLVLVFFDLDGLKRVNDTLGHEAGSRLIRRFSELMVANFRKSDVIARVGGDEFIALAVGSRETADDLSARLQRAIDGENRTTSEEFQIAYSAGFAMVEPGVDHAVEAAMARADGFMYEQKRQKKLAALAVAAGPEPTSIQPPVAITAHPFGNTGAEWEI